MTETSIFLGLVIFVSCLAFSIWRSKKNGRITLLDWSILGLGLIYGLGWALVIALTDEGYNTLWAPWITQFENYFLTLNALTFVLGGCIVAGWSASNYLYTTSRKLSHKNLSLKKESIHKYAWTLFFIALILRWIYVRDLGGFIGYLDHSASIRSAIFEVENRFSFLQPFGMVAIFSSFLFFSSLMDGKISTMKVLGLMLSISLSLYVLYSLLGRVEFIVYASTFALAILQKNNIKPVAIIAGGILGAAGLLISTYVMSNFLDLKGAGNFPEYIARELSFPFVSFFAQLNSGEHLFRWYMDFIQAPLYLLPSSLWTQWIEEASQINTMVILGAKKGDLGVTGGIPVDLLTIGLMQSSVAGIAIVGLLFGAMIRFLQGVVDGIQEKGLRSIISAYIAIKIAVCAIAYAHPAHVIAGNFGLLFSILLIASLAIASRIRLGNYK